MRDLWMKFPLPSEIRTFSDIHIMAYGLPVERYQLIHCKNSNVGPCPFCMPGTTKSDHTYVLYTIHLSCGDGK